MKSNFFFFPSKLEPKALDVLLGAFFTVDLIIFLPYLTS